MTAETPPPLDFFLADEVHRRAEELSDQWIQQLEVRPASPEELADDALLLTEWAAAALRSAGPVTSPEARSRLRLFVRARRERGARLEEILADLHLLCSLIGRVLVRAVQRYPGPVDSVRVVECADRVRAEFAAIDLLVMGLFQQDAEEESRELSRRLEEFGHMIVHELKNPLSNIQLGADMLQEQIVRAEVEGEPDRYLGWIQRGVRRAIDLLDDVRVLAMVEGAQAETRWSSARGVVENVFSQLRDAARKNGVSCEIVEPLPEVEVEAVQVGVALINLVGNAIKYSDPAKPRRWVRVGLRPGEGGWEFLVSDNGLGIPAHAQDRVFQRHFRAHPTAAEGTGLGLAITEQVIRQRQGRIWFESEEGVGTTFVFHIPERREPAPRGRPQTDALPTP